MGGSGQGEGQGDGGVTLAGIAAQLAPHRLQLLGGFAVAPDEPGFPRGTRTLLLIGPGGAEYWPHLKAQPEWDGAPDPVDRWSRRVIGRLACDLGGKALFPFGGPPYHPFYTWALRSGRAFASPVRLLVHDAQGLWVSFRGALALREAVDVPQGRAPCAACAEKPCLAACPAGALGAQGYDVPRCHGFLDSPGGENCLSGGCLVRRACPASQAYARLPEQSAYHMGLFHR
ncbi:ferredoxin [Xinfangfangia pollutisoli]|uniref:ferredoxin n=1 Tax=Xinfangfangia pollutisoli TaxID=2865960 RepID=UPI001CD5FE73|nr:ferredoxin [Xinfangfangia pollutisoli]